MLLLAFLACGEPDTTFANPGDDTASGVEGTATASITPAELVWTAVDVGYSSVLQLTIASVGDGDLVLYDLSLLNDTTESFVFDRVEDLTLAPGESETFDVTCDLETAITAEANIRVRTNDTTQAEVSVPLTCSPA